MLAALVATLVVLFNLDAPLVEDGLFWWVPKALWMSENGFAVVLDQLPAAADPDGPLPPQWEGGLPDYAHPPLWYAWMALFLKLPLKVHHAVHLAALPMAAAFGWGCAALLRRVGGDRAAWTAMALPLVPPIAAQLLRADTDLPLLAATPWCLVFILDRRDAPFAVLAALATWCKEPGILLAAPALVACLLDRRRGWGWLAPPAALAAWAGVHYAAAGWGLAGTERLPETVGHWLSDVGTVLWIVVGEQWRFLLLPLVVFGLWKWTPRRRALALLGVHTAVQLLFFGTLNFLGGIDRLDAYTHVRYLLPGLVGWLVMVLSVAPPAAAVLAVVSVFFLHRPSVHGPESSLYGLDVARAVRDTELPLDQGPVWVGSYAWTQLTRPYAGVVDQPVEGLHVYGHDTDPAEVAGYVIEACEGEPLGRIQERSLKEVSRTEVGHAWVRVLLVE
jgi:hypothetical protein